MTCNVYERRLCKSQVSSPDKKIANSETLSTGLPQNSRISQFDDQFTSVYFIKLSD